jgi:hypothetical protein
VETMPTPQSPAPESTPAMSLGARTVAVFARPARAWTGLERKGQWWFPLLIVVLISLAGTALIYQRAVVPTILGQFDAKVESGEITQAMADDLGQRMTGPVAMAFNLGSVLVAVPAVTLLTALLPWLAVAFLLGRRFRYRDAFVVTCWAGLVAIPAQLLTYGLAWANESMENLHDGFGVLLPVGDEPSKLMAGLGAFLDKGIGPFSLWYVAVLALGAAALSGAPRKRTILTLGGVWIVVLAIYAVLAGLLGRGA